MIKIAYDPQIFSMQIYGGVSRYFYEIASRISKNPDVDVKIVAPMYVNAYLENLPKGILRGFCSPLPYNFLQSQQRLTSMFLGNLMLRSMRPDIVHETYYSRLPLGPKQAYRVLTIYDMIHEKFESQFHYSNRTAKHKTIAAARANHVICISESTKRDVIEILGLKPEKISVIHLGFDLVANNIKAESQQIDAIGKPYLLYVGARDGYKNFQRMLVAYATSQLLKSEFKLVCFGGGSFQAEELAAIQKLGLSADQIIQLSGDDQLLAKLYKRASVFIFPSLYEGFGIPPLEAMSYGCPVVCSNAGSIPEVVGGAAEDFDPISIDSMCRSIERVVERSGYREALIAKGYERLKYFSWDKCASETFDVYKKLT